MLLQTQVQVDEAQQWAVHTKEVIARVEEIYRRLLESYTGIRILAVPDNLPFGRPFVTQKVPEQIEELRRLVSDNGSQQPRISLSRANPRHFRTGSPTKND